MSQSSRPPVSPSSYIAPGLGILLVAGGLGLHMGGSADPQPAARPVQSVVDPRLILRPHRTSMDATLSGGVRLAGAHSPSLPGMNTLALTLRSPRGDMFTNGRIDLTVTMPGMGMIPARATLALHAGAYRG